MTEIEWLDGGVTKVPELALGDAFGESVQAELDFGFDDVLEGLWVEVRHHEPDEDSDGDPRGSGCALYAGCRYSLVEPSDLDRVFCILYEGQPRVCRVAGELVNLSRACALSCLNSSDLPARQAPSRPWPRALDTSAVRLSRPTSPPAPAPRGS